MLRGIPIARSAVLLGIPVGPDADGLAWPPLFVKMRKRLRMVRALGLGIPRSVFLYNAVAFGSASYSLSLAPLIKDAIRNFNRLLRLFQFLTAAPVNAFPSEILFHLRGLGLGQSVNHARWAMASQLRVARSFDLVPHEQYWNAIRS